MAHFGCRSAALPYPAQRSDAAGALPGGHAGEHVGQLLLGVQLLCGGGQPTGCTNAPAQAASGNNGNVAGSWYQDNVNPSFSHTEAYGYDGVNRLTSAVATGNSLYNLAYSYDRYGNSNCVLNGNTNGPCAQFAYNAANQITGYGYDAAGNTTYDGTYTYTWDAEGRLSTSWQGATLEHTYTYNALGQRAEDIPDTQTGNTQEWFYDPSGQVLGDFFAYPPQPGWWHMLVPALGRTFVDVEGWYVGAAWIYHYNALGSPLTATRQDGTEVLDTQFYPWGGGWLNGGGWGTWLTGIYAGLIYFQCQFVPCMDQSQTRDYPGYHWMSPDALGGSITNPQSLNRYAYALNNPTTLTDPTGLQSGYECQAEGYNPNCWGIYQASWAPDDSNSWQLPNNINCMAGEYGCAGTPSQIQLAEASYIYNNCIGCVWVHGTLYGQSISEIFSSFAAWANYATSQAALPENQAYQVYMLACQYATNPCSGTNDSVSVWLKGITYNGQIDSPLDVAAAAQDGFQDPTGMMHNGDDSWYIDSFAGLFGFEVGHVVNDPYGMEVHYDDFGPLNPLHYVIQVPLGAIIQTPSQPYTCSVIGGCQ